MSASRFNIQEAKSQLSRIIARAEAGEEIIISRDGRPVAKIVGLASPVRRAARGSLRGQIEFADGWDSRATNEGLARNFGLR